MWSKEDIEGYGYTYLSGNVGAAGNRLNTALQGFNNSISPKSRYKEDDWK